MACKLVALTGGTGFLGRHLGVALAARGYRLRVLARRDPTHPLWRDIVPEVVPGDLGSPPALAQLVDGADVVIHLAGLTRARSRREFQRVNCEGAARLAGMMRRHAPEAHLIAVSSLAAREPGLSGYAASKRAGETAMAEAFAGGRLTIIRPPVIYGPWDRATLAIFRMAAGPIVPVPGPPGSRIAMIHVQDAAEALAALTAWKEAPGGTIYALADTKPAGYSPRYILECAAASLGHAPHFVRLPDPAIRLAGHAAGLLARIRGQAALFSAGKARELLQGTWSVSPEELFPTAVARPAIDLRSGCATTVAWYHEAGWLPRKTRQLSAAGAHRCQHSGADASKYEN